MIAAATSGTVTARMGGHHFTRQVFNFNSAYFVDVTDEEYETVMDEGMNLFSYSCATFEFVEVVCMHAVSIIAAVL